MDKIIKIVIGLILVMVISACIPSVEQDRDEYLITFSSDGGTRIDDVLVEENRSFLEPNQPVKEGYTFNGWYSDSLLNNTYNFTFPVAGDINLYAAWTVNQYTMIFESNGGSDVLSIEVDYDTLVNQPVNPEMEHYIFTGWYEDSELLTTFDFSSKITDNITLYAGWEIKSLYIPVLNT